MDNPTIIAIVNHKGGAGKTTITTSLGGALAREGKKTLMVDLDSQANLTLSLTEPSEGMSVYDAVKKMQPLPAVNVAERLDLAPSSFDMMNADRNFVGSEWLSRSLRPVSTDYDFVLLDCPPAVGNVTVNALTAATHVLVPVVADKFSILGLNKITDAIDVVTHDFNPSLTLLGIVINQWNNRNVNKLYEQELRRVHGDKVFDTRIRTNVAIQEAQACNETIFDYNPSSIGAADFLSLLREVLGKIHQ